MSDHHFIVRVQVTIPDPPAGPPSWQTREFAAGVLRRELALMTDPRIAEARISQSDPDEWAPQRGLRHLEGLLTIELLEGDLIRVDDVPVPVRVLRVIPHADGVAELRVSTQNGTRVAFVPLDKQWKVTR